MISQIDEIAYKPSIFDQMFHVGIRINSPAKSSTLKNDHPPNSIWDDEMEIGKYETIYTYISVILFK